MNLCFLGALSTKDLPTEADESIESIDILFVPVSSDTLSPADAYKLAVKLEPKLIIPVSTDAAAIKTFLKEAGEEGQKPQDKLTLKRKDLDGKDADVVVLEAQA